MSKLLARAKVKRHNAENDYTMLGADDAYVDDCCYNLQQSIELALKYLVEINGENYVENHDVRAQLNKLRELGVELPLFDDLRHMAVTLNSWEADTRYNDNFTALVEDIDDARALSDKLIDYCDKQVSEI